MTLCVWAVLVFLYLLSLRQHAAGGAGAETESMHSLLLCTRARMVNVLIIFSFFQFHAALGSVVLRWKINNFAADSIFLYQWVIINGN